MTGEGLSEARARALRFMLDKSGIVKAPGEVVACIDEMVRGTGYVAVTVTERGLAALLDYERRHVDSTARTRIAAGMSAAGRRALSSGQGGGAPS